MMASPENSGIRYDTALIKLMSFFESATGAKLKDCFVDQNGLLVFVVEPAQYGLAVGKGGSNVRRIQHAIKRDVKVVEYSANIAEFVESLIQPSKAKSIELSGDVVTITPDSSISRSHLIGRSGKNVRNFESIIKRYFPIRELKVV